ncbi:hypothetical protein ILYODFUR_002663 [Ilyodon furcidens]|uniref:Uncharacterized protein n=1 Tax=Ilyodon furcidens TaxID=33524 RepID=A0ABV0UFU8_9TELE
MLLPSICLHFGPIQPQTVTLRGDLLCHALPHCCLLSLVCFSGLSTSWGLSWSNQEEPRVTDSLRQMPDYSNSLSGKQNPVQCLFMDSSPLPLRFQVHRGTHSSPGCSSISTLWTHLRSTIITHLPVHPPSSSSVSGKHNTRTVTNPHRSHNLPTSASVEMLTPFLASSSSQQQ